MLCSTAGIILAGGQSKRMGTDKAFLPAPGYEQKTFVEHLASMLAAFCTDIVLVARDATHAEQYLLPGIRIVTDQIANVGPLMGVYSGLRAIQASHALVLAVDMPYVRPDILSLLLSQPLDEALLVPMVDNVPQVLLAIYPRSLLPLIEERLHSGRRDPRSLLEIAPVRYIKEAQLRQVDPHLRSFINVNTPQELAQSL